MSWTSEMWQHSYSVRGRETRAKEIVFHESETFQRNPFNFFAGLEPEVLARNDNARKLRTLARKWSGLQLVGDCTLSAGGYEVNTPPTNGDLLLTRLNELGAALAANEATVDASCGCHVHLDARSMSKEAKLRFLLLWTHLEPAIATLLPSYRRRSRWAKFLSQDVALAPQQLYHYLYAERGALCHKHFAIRTETGRNTIEIRSLEGTTSADTMKNWTMLCMAILRVSEDANRMVFTRTFSPEKVLSGDPGLVVSPAPRDALRKVLTAALKEEATGVHHWVSSREGMFYSVEPNLPKGLAGYSAVAP